MYQLTIYTPTFNRADTLKRVYESLCQQTCKNFYWLVIDDGSTDKTKELVEKWILESKINIIYKYKKNEGVHTARDFAYKFIETELLTGVDSDDWLVDYAVEAILDNWNENIEDYIGIFYPCIKPDGTPLYENYPQIKKATYQDFAYKYGFNKDKMTVVKSDIMKELLVSPKFSNENLVPETFKWIQLPELNFKVEQKPLKIVDYQDTGYTLSSVKNYFANSRGVREQQLQHAINSKFLGPKIRGYIYTILFSFHLNDLNYLKLLPNGILTFALLPIGFLSYLYKKGKNS